ncbi:hypothetical protein TIFTF001_009012 [Ficus carica]|uniref:Uncharacterized protein n=1 Tax=Ficus carica TaxID=3494 RepID=A0AA88AG46_FICCA|nr:hypothetical protein TIFTF001_009012 [Ficus carica]
MNEFSSTSEHEEEDQSSENKLSDDDSFLVMTVVVMAASRRYRRRDPQPMHNSRLTGGHVDVNANVVLPDGADDAGPSTGS